jgi:hypothetical protein
MKKFIYLSILLILALVLTQLLFKTGGVITYFMKYTSEICNLIIFYIDKIKKHMQKSNAIKFPKINYSNSLKLSVLKTTILITVLIIIGYHLHKRLKTNLDNS